MVIFVEGHSHVPVETIAKKNNSIRVVDFLKDSYDKDLRKGELISKFNSVFGSNEKIAFVLLTCNLGTAKRLGMSDKKKFKKNVNYYNWAFSLLPVKKRKIDISVVGLKSAFSKIEKMLDEE